MPAGALTPGRAPGRAMVLAAGLGLRLRPITDRMPKPLVAVGGRAMLDRALDRLAACGVAEAVVNSHYLAHRIEAHLAGRGAPPRTRVSHEAALLDTGGGVARALPLLGRGPFYVVNADIVWLDGRRPALARLAEAWRDDAMDALLLVHPTVLAFGYRGLGDFHLDQLGRARRRRAREVSPFAFTGVQLLHPRLLAGAPDGAFSLNAVYDRAAAGGRLFGLVHDGAWFHVGAPEALAEAEAELGSAPGRG